MYVDFLTFTFDEWAIDLGQSYEGLSDYWGVYFNTLGSVGGPSRSIVGSMTGAYVAGKIFDKFIKDDPEECFYLFKKEFIDFLYSIELLAFLLLLIIFNSSLKED